MSKLKDFFQKIWKFCKANYVYLILFAVFLIFDQLTKVFFTDKYIPVINGVFSFTYTQNTGAGFSVLSGKVWLLILLSVLFLIGLVVFNHFQKNKSKLYKVSYVLILSGAIGNLIDRIFLGYVRDFLSFDLIHFPVFNIADSCLTIGIILLCIFFVFYDKPKDKNLVKEGQDDFTNNQKDNSSNDFDYVNKEHKTGSNSEKVDVISNSLQANNNDSGDIQTNVNAKDSNE